jgi:hypothetical protein
MRKISVVPVLLALVALVALGCATFKGETVVKYESGTSPNMIEAPEGGTYQLFDASDLSPKVTVVLDRGARIGFDRSEAGSITAVAGSQRVRLSADRNYYWKRT